MKRVVLSIFAALFLAQTAICDDITEQTVESTVFIRGLTVPVTYSTDSVSVEGNTTDETVENATTTKEPYKEPILITKIREYYGSNFLSMLHNFMVNNNGTYVQLPRFIRRLGVGSTVFYFELYYGELNDISKFWIQDEVSTFYNQTNNLIHIEIPIKFSNLMILYKYEVRGRFSFKGVLHGLLFVPEFIATVHFNCTSNSFEFRNVSVSSNGTTEFYFDSFLMKSMIWILNLFSWNGFSLVQKDIVHPTIIKLVQTSLSRTMVTMLAELNANIQERIEEWNATIATEFSKTNFNATTEFGELNTTATTIDLGANVTASLNKV